MAINRIGIVGYGHFGKFLEELSLRFYPEIDVRIYSRRADVDNTRFFFLADVAACDVVILCGAISEYETQLQALQGLLSPSTIVVDVATVKVYTEALFAKLLPQQPYICMHPMFGPESYQKHQGDITGFRVVITAGTIPQEQLNWLTNTLSGLGFEVVSLTSDEHDKLLAQTLFLTHYISQSMVAAGFGRTAIDTSSFGSLMHAVESVKNDSTLFVDVYKYNPHCQEVADVFHGAQEQVWKSIQ